ncbi:MAG: DUF169 domain-containing protein [bacterium]|nr:DUF169 domain-containing protein [bacterium]
MKSILYDELKLRYPPVAIVFSDAKPEAAIELEEDSRVCVITTFVGAAKGNTAAISRERHGCNGALNGLCLEKNEGTFYPGFEYFMSTGGGDYEEGEGYVKTPEIARSYLDNIPQISIPQKYVIFKPIIELSDGEEPAVVVFLATPDQLSALTVLANYARETANNVIIPMGAGCHQICLLPYHYSLDGPCKAIVGMTDIAARKFYDPDVLTFAVPFAMFEEMEGNIEGSFLDKGGWKELKDRIV